MKPLSVLIVVIVLSLTSAAQEMTVAAAADLHSAMEEIAAQFQRQNAAKIKVVYGSSGNFYQQIQNGAPFDLFFSANTEYPKKLEAAGLTTSGTYLEYARGKIVVLIPAASTFDLKQGLTILLDPAVKKVAIADPAHAPYGLAAAAALKSQHIYEQVAPKLVTGENISQAASYVLSGGADAGIVAMSLAVLPSSQSKARFVAIPENEYPPITQACVVLKSSKQQELAREFESFVKSADAGKILQRYGFEVPDSAVQKSLQ
jgi:molybdate transport system substrate-binding protein